MMLADKFLLKFFSLHNDNAMVKTKYVQNCKGKVYTITIEKGDKLNDTRHGAARLYSKGKVRKHIR